MPWPVRKRFNSDHEQRGRSKPGCREVGSSTIAQLVTEADCQCGLAYPELYTGSELNGDEQPVYTLYTLLMHGTL